MKFNLIFSSDVIHVLVFSTFWLLFSKSKRFFSRIYCGPFAQSIKHTPRKAVLTNIFSSLSCSSQCSCGTWYSRI
uniref:Uncharacterized protein n=1 Tax=Arundo donax TaxID=35708 RepID=A0A0A9GUI4_ARUDO